MQVKSILSAELAGLGQAAAAGINSVSFTDLLAVLLHETSPPCLQTPISQGDQIPEVPEDLPPDPPSDNEGNLEEEWTAASFLQCVNAEQDVPAVSPEERNPEAGEKSKENRCLTEGLDSGNTQLPDCVRTEVEASRSWPDRPDKISKTQTHGLESPIEYFQQSVPSPEIGQRAREKVPAEAKSQLSVQDSEVILPDAKAHVIPEVIPYQESPSEYRRAQIETITKTWDSDEGGHQKGTPVHLPPNGKVVVSQSRPAPRRDSFQEVPISNWPGKEVEVPIPGKVFPGKPLAPVEKTSQPSPPVPEMSSDAGPGPEPENLKFERLSPAPVPRPNLDTLDTSDANRSSPAPVSRQNLDTLDTPEANRSSPAKEPRTVPSDQPAVSHEIPNLSQEKLLQARGYLAQIRVKDADTRSESDIMLQKHQKADHDPADAVSLSKVYGTALDGRQETVVVAATEMEQIPASVFRHMETGQGGRQIIFKLDPPDLGQVLVTIREQAGKGLEARVVLEKNIPQQQIDALAARFAEISRPEVHVRIEIAASFVSSRNQEDSTGKKERSRQHSRPRNVKSANDAAVFYG